jgi:hypothetical protein
MPKMSIDELYRELEATDEQYIRRKLLLNGYPPAQRKIVQEWLAQQDAKRVQAQTAHNLAISSRNAYWTKIAALGTLLGAIITLVTFFR